MRARTPTQRDAIADRGAVLRQNVTRAENGARSCPEPLSKSRELPHACSAEAKLLSGSNPRLCPLYSAVNAVDEVARERKPARQFASGEDADQLPLPESGTLCGLFLALSVIVTLPDFEPFDAGVNFTSIRHVLPGVRLVDFVQLVPVANAKFPLMLRAVRVSVVVPVFLSVTALAALVVPVF